MAQHDFVIDNQTFPNFRTDLNDAWTAIVSQSSGGTEPTTTYAYQLWYDNGNNVLKIRNAANNAWIALFTFNQTDGTAEVSAGGGAGYFQGDNGTSGDQTNGKKDIFRTHETELNTSTTIASGDNSHCAFSLAIASGVTLTVSGNLVIT
tara:strand:- start:854 stop:1300 length:447 start_codon:yes stop_codon:yes gene_type:complete